LNRDPKSEGHRANLRVREISESRTAELV